MKKLTITEKKSLINNFVQKWNFENCTIECSINEVDEFIEVTLFQVYYNSFSYWDIEKIVNHLGNCIDGFKGIIYPYLTTSYIKQSEEQKIVMKFTF